MWVLFVGTTLLGFSEREVRLMTYEKWSTLFNYFKKYHNFKTKQGLFHIEPTEEEIQSLEWFTD